MAWKKGALALVWGLAVLGWAGVVGYYFTEPSTREWTIAVTGAAILTEVAVWTSAAILGLTIWESRKAVFRFLTRPFRRTE